MDNVTRLLMQGAAGASGDKTYVDDVFSTYLWEGDGSARSINTGVDMTEGGLTWIRRRNQATDHYLFDTVSGATKYLASNDNMAQQTDTATLTAFNNNGFSLGTNGGVNGNGNDFVGWSFRKAPGFFDVVTYTGNGTAGRTVAHNLGCVPGMVIIKKTSNSGVWGAGHRSLDWTAGDYLVLSSDVAAASHIVMWNDTAPTSTHVTLGTSSTLNTNGEEYVMYLFAGGASTAATARSVVCDASGDYLSLGSSSDLAMGTGDFTIEGWYKINAKQNFGFFMNGPSGLSSTYGTVVWNYTGSSYGLQFITSGGYQATGFTPPPDQWFHLALVRNSGTTSLYYNGELLKAAADTTNYTNTTFQIGGYDSSPYLMNGSVSNFRIVKGTAVYTSSFRVPTEPLTAITNTVLLCCNNSSTTGSTVTPGTITANGDPTASTDSPFDDPEGFKFGEGGDQNIIKCGSYIGNGSSDGPDINLGWEPQWFIVKNVTSSNTNWLLFDSMRGLTDSDQYWEANIKPNSSDAEWDNEYLSPTSRGFRLTNGGSTWVNESGSKFIYIAIRRPDGYVGKPAEAGTDVLTMTPGTSGAPLFLSPNHIVDFALQKSSYQSGTADWTAVSRLTQGLRLETNTNDVESANTYQVGDYQNGWSSYTGGDGSRFAWLFKRHAGFDVVTYTGNQYGGRQIPHSLGKTPEMMWLKYRAPSGYAEDWQVYHKGLNGGVDPQDYSIRLDSTNAEYNSVNDWNDTAPTSTHFTIGSDGRNNRDGSSYINMLFASVDGISKCGYYDGTGSAGHVITTGFTPRFLIIKTTNQSNGWFVYDSVRGLGAGADPYLQIQNNNSQAGTSDDVFATSSTGFTINQNYASVNASGQKYIYYAHA